MTSLIGDAGRSRSSTFSSSSNFSWCRSPAELPEFRYASGSQSRGLVVSSGYSLKGIAENLKVNCDEGDIVIPNYFEPFVQKNIAINYFTDSQALENLRIYKADGDQDRPNFFNEPNYL